jgi:N-ethylmaleimide reductase
MSPTANYKLFTPFTLAKDLVLKNRIVFSPLTRTRSETEHHLPNDLNVEYYAQRTGAGLIISEASAVSPQAFGWYGAAALYNDTQVPGWRKITDAVHAKDGKIFLQLWHMGRQAHSSFNDGKQVVSASATQLMGGRLRNNEGEHVKYEMARPLETDEIPGVVEMYRHAAELAKQAGFDGVEVHGANGYLLDQFLQSSTNHRTDKYGGSIENRARLLLEVIDALTTVWPSDRIGLRLAPNGIYGGMGSPDNYEQFVYTAQELGKRNLAYLTLLDADGKWGFHNKGRAVTLLDAKVHFKGTVVANVSYTRDKAEGALRTGAADLVAFGRPYMANPDLAERFQNDWPIVDEAPREFWFNHEKGAEGYTTYPAYNPEGSAAGANSRI